MDNKKIVEDIFKNHDIVWEVKNFNKYVNPSCKSEDSIYSKLVRLYYTSKNSTSYTVNNSGINDLLRLTIVEDYEKVPDIIIKLKKFFPDLTGYINKKNSGYRGIHLNLKIDQIPCEIQIAPEIVMMAVDYLHTLHVKWRDFNVVKELNLLAEEELKISKIDDRELRANLLNEIELKKSILQENIKKEKEDYELRKSTYKDVFDAAKFDVYENEISKVLDEINSSNSSESSISSFEDSSIQLFNENLLVNKKLDEEKVREIAKKIPELILKTQDKFFNLVKDYLENN